MVGVGSAAPDRVVTNAEVAAGIGVDEEWIVRRTGTRVRHVAAPGERLEAFATTAAQRALERAGIDGAAVDAVIVGTTSPDEMSPHAAPQVAYGLGASHAAAFDISAACTGFLTGLGTGAGLIESERAETVVVVGADFLSAYVDRSDRGSAMLFGDGAGAVVLTRTDGAARVGPVRLHSDGEGRDLIRLGREDYRIRMDGPTVFKYAVRCMSEVTLEALSAAGATLEEIDLFVYHQANARIIDAVGRRLELDPAKVVDVVGDFANTSAGTLPIALDAARESGRLHDGDRILLSAFGAGMVWGAGVLTWGR